MLTKTIVMDTNLDKDIYELKTSGATWEETVLFYISNPHSADAGDKIRNQLKEPVTFIELQVKDWDRYLTPWKTEGRFKGEAKVILDVIETR